MIKGIEADEAPATPTRDELRAFLTSGWGALGARVYAAWEEYNARYFGDELAPCIVAMVPTSPHGRWSGLTCHSRAERQHAHLIYLATSGRLNGGRGVLLHEMTHAYLVQRGLDPKHAGLPWCEEITRLSALLGRPDVVALPERSVRRDGRIVKEPRAGSITRAAAATWPHSIGLDLGAY